MTNHQSTTQQGRQEDGPTGLPEAFRSPRRSHRISAAGGGFLATGRGSPRPLLDTSVVKSNETSRSVRKHWVSPRRWVDAMAYLLGADGLKNRGARLAACGKMARMFRCGVCSSSKPVVLRCMLTRLCWACARASARKWLHRAFTVAERHPRKTILVTASIRPRPGEHVTDERYLMRVSAVGVALWRLAKSWGADAGVRAVEHGPLNGTGHIHAVFGAEKRLFIPRWRIMVTVLRATRTDHPGRQLPKALVRTVRLAALRWDTVERRAKKSGRKPRVTERDIEAAKVQVERWARENGASWYCDVREIVDARGGLAECIKYITKFSAVDPGLAIQLDDAYQHRRRIQLLGVWRERVTDWACDDCGEVVTARRKPNYCACRGHHLHEVGKPSCETCGRKAELRPTDMYVRVLPDGTIVGVTPDDTVAALKVDTC